MYYKMIIIIINQMNNTFIQNTDPTLINIKQMDEAETLDLNNVTYITY